jgi:hypothetical protein
MTRAICTDATENGQIYFNLQYVDDIIVFVDEDTSAKNLKWILTYFELMSSMRINYHKSELVLVNVGDPSEVQQYADIFGCPVRTLPIKYLGIPLHFANHMREDLQPLIDKIVKRIAGWRGKLLTQVGRLILIKTCLASILFISSFLSSQGGLFIFGITVRGTGNFI